MLNILNIKGILNLNSSIFLVIKFSLWFQKSVWWCEGKRYMKMIKKIMRQIFLETKTVYKYRPQIWKFSFSLRRQVRKELKAASRNHTNFSDGEIWGNPFTLICKPLESFHRYYPCLESIIQWAERPHW